MLFFPLVIWFGLATIVSLFVTLSFGIAMHKFKKNVFRYHMFFAFLTGTLAVVHLIFAILLWFYGITI